MKFISDLHIHSKYSRACSNKLTIPNLEKWARIKGVNLLGTGDFTHPKWIQHLKKNLKENNGFLQTKSGFNFVLQTEISLIYTQNKKGRKIHNIVLAPSFEIVDQITEELLKKGRVDYDGRPIFKIPCPEFVELMRSISKDIEIIPAHCMTPHFGILGEYNQFNSIKDCFQEQTKHIHAIETGLSADLNMLFRIPQLDKFLLISSSDSHSFWPWRIGRETTLFDIKSNYKSLLNAIRTKKGFQSTIEFWPEEGKYHFTGHRKCNISMDPKTAISKKNICPVCQKKLTIGVAQRVEKLATRAKGFKPKNAQKSRHLIPLSELLSVSLNKSINTKTVWKEYYKLIKNFKTEFNILLNVSKDQLKKVTDPNIAELIEKNRKELIKIKPGYDGVYGKILIKNNNKNLEN